MVEPAPAIRTAMDDRFSLRASGSKPAGDPKDLLSGMEQIERIGSDTRHHRGLGDVGTVVDLVDMSGTTFGGCPRCNETEMVLSKDLGADSVDIVAYCTNLKCPHFVQDAVEHDMNRIRADKPEVWDNTAECPECGDRFTTQLRRHMAHEHDYVTGNVSEGGVLGDVLCDECSPSLDREAEA